MNQTLKQRLRAGHNGQIDSIKIGHDLVFATATAVTAARILAFGFVAVLVAMVMTVSMRVIVITTAAPTLVMMVIMGMVVVVVVDFGVVDFG